MKKYLLTLLTLLVILAPNVKAEECINLYPYEPGTLYFTSVYQVGYVSYFYLKDIEELDSSKTYTFYALKDNQLIENLLYSARSFHYNRSYLLEKSASITLTNITSFKDGFYFFQQQLTTDDEIYKELQSWQFWLVEGDSVCIPSTEPDEPEKPVADATLDNFYSIYLDKLGMLANFATENKIFFSAIGILLSFVVFELFFMLFRGRRKRR